MAQVFNANEVFNIGVQIEKNGKKFYLELKRELMILF
jgi:protein associated with RNAse G/E